MSDSVTIFSPATIGNVGPGFDCLGLCVTGLGDVFRVRRSTENRIVNVSGVGADKVPMDPSRNTVTIASQFVFQEQGAEGGIEVSIERSLPIAGGLGSSAASAVAGAKAAAELCGLTDEKLIMKAALSAEASVAGWHLDNIAPCLYGGLVLVQDVKSFSLVKLPVAKGWWITLLSPSQLLETKASREALPKEVSWQLMVRQMTSALCLAEALREGDGELLRNSFKDEFAEAARGPLIRDFFRIKEAALASGALACSISGGGPTIFAVSQDEETAKSISIAMEAATSDASVHVGMIADQGVRVIQE